MSASTSCLLSLSLIPKSLASSAWVIICITSLGNSDGLDFVVSEHYGCYKAFG